MSRSGHRNFAIGAQVVRGIGAALLLAIYLLAPHGLAEGRRLPQTLALAGLTKGGVKRGELSGRRVVLQFFASWCVGCGDAMGELAPLLRSSQALKYVLVSVDESVEDARSFFRKQSLAVRALEDIAVLDEGAKLAAILAVPGVPTIVVVDKDGTVVSMVTGHPDRKQLELIKSFAAGEG